MTATAKTATAKPRPMSILYWMALGTFAIGTEGFMIAPLLPSLAEDLSVGLVAAGQLVTVFTLSYAFSSPILTALTGGIGRRNLLIVCMAGFAAANVVAAVATSYWMLMAARILLALASGLYVPNANALAGAVVAPEKRERRFPSLPAEPRSPSLSASRSALTPAPSGSGPITTSSTAPISRQAARDCSTSSARCRRRCATRSNC